METSWDKGSLLIPVDLRVDHFIGRPWEVAGGKAKAKAEPRTCNRPKCDTKLSIYNKGKYCGAHTPWMPDDQGT